MIDKAYIVNENAVVLNDINSAVTANVMHGSQITKHRFKLRDMRVCNSIRFSISI